MKMTQAQVDEWNKTFPEGSPCFLLKDNGTEILTRTRSSAWLVSGYHPVVLVSRFTGGYSLDRLRMMETHRL